MAYLRELSNGIEIQTCVGSEIEGYILKSITTNFEVNETNVEDECGKLIYKGIKEVFKDISINAVVKSDATPESDWPAGDFATVDGFTDYFVKNLTINKTVDPTEVTVELRYLPNLVGDGESSSGT